MSTTAKTSAPGDHAIYAKDTISEEVKICNATMYRGEITTPTKPSIQREYLEVFVKVEVSSVLCLGFRLCGCVFMLLLCAGHDTSLLVITNTLLEEVGLAGQRDVLHEVEWVGRLVDLLVSESNKQAIGNELDVLFHQSGIHAKKSARKSLSQELLLDFDRLGDDVLDGLLAWAMLQMGEKEACKVGVETLVTGDELVREGKTSHETALLQPEDGCE
jgi:hypothetical protein